MAEHVGGEFWAQQSSRIVYGGEEIAKTVSRGWRGAGDLAPPV